MEDLFLAKTKNTPKIDFKKNGSFEFSGRSVMDNHLQFFKIIEDWILEYSNVIPSSTIIFKIDVDYIDTTTETLMFSMIYTVSSLLKKNHSITFRWFFGNGDIEELGYHFSDHFPDVSFEFVKKI